MGNICYKNKRNRNIDTDQEQLLWSFKDECSICMENPIQTALLDCGHMNLCLKCAKEMSLSNTDYLNKCPICRADFKGYVTFSPNINYFNKIN